MRGQPKPLSGNYLSEMAGASFFVLISFQRSFLHSQAAVFSFGRAFVCCVCLAFYYLVVCSVLGSLMHMEQTLEATATSTRAV